MPKHYTLAAHLMHSGLQMVWKRLDIDKGRSPERTANDNKVIFEKVAAALTRQFNIKITKEDHTAAAEMLLISLVEEPVTYYQVMLSDGGSPRPVSSPDGGVTIVTADPAERMTYEQAVELRAGIWKHRGMALIHIRERYTRELRDTE